MKKITITLSVILLFLVTINAQNLEKIKAENYIETKGELTFTFQMSTTGLKDFENKLSIVHYDPDSNIVKAWANEEQFRFFEALNIPYQVPENENEVDENSIYDVRPLASRGMMSTLTFPLGSYPTYAEYAQQMQDFEDDYPALVEKVSIGATGQGDKELLFVKISDNVSVDEAEPKLMFTSSMHGDDIAGYPMMLTLIDYILTVYNDTGHTDHARVKNLVENAEIWINPSANPDGTYHNSASNTSVANARRGNGNNIDLNRNYPDNVQGAHPDGEVYQTETIAFMNFADQHNFVIAANFHGGTELVNYPFDNAYASSQYTHADGDWYEFVGVEYATHCQTDANAGNTSTPSYTNKASYMTDDEDSSVYPSPGVTHGAEWYRVYGGRQDYMNFYHQCRETTIELSDTKILPESSLIDYWYYNRDALLDYLTQGTYGFRGVVKDASTTNTIEGATITVVGHDAYGSEVSSDTNGDFYRPIKGGTYNLTISAPCYQSVTLSNQSISDYTIVDLSDILLTPLTPSIPNSLNATAITASTADLGWTSSEATFDLRYREVGSGSWTDVLGLSTNSNSLSALNPDTNYEYQVRSKCESNTSSYSPSFLFATLTVSYCSSSGTTQYETGVTRVVFGDIDHVDGPLKDNGYENFTNISTNVTQGTTVDLTVRVNTDGGYTVHAFAWIDWNKNGDFNDSGEEYDLGDITNVSNGALPTLSIAIPESMNFGNTRMRVSARYNDNPSYCQNDFDGEVEDYTVNVRYNGLRYSGGTWIPSAPSGSTSSEDVLVEEGTYNVNSAISVNNITVNSGATINVDKSESITVAGNITNNGEFILNSDSNEFSSLMVDGTVTGDIKYNRYANSNAGGNDLIAPPVSGQSFVDFLSNNSNVLSNSGQTLYLFGPFEKPSNDYVLFANNETANLEAGKGYRVASTDNGTFTFSGNVSTGNVTVPIVKVGSNFDKWNLIGNPYTTYISLADFLAANISELDPFSAAIYGYDADTSNGSNWTIWNLAYSDANPGALIAPGQGFFVSSKNGGANISFTPSMRAIGTSDDFIAGRNNNTIGHSILRMTTSENTFETEIYFNDNSTLGLDLGYDAEHFGGAPSGFSIYSKLAENNQGLDMAIQSISTNDISDTTVIPLGVNVASGQEVMISIENTNVTQDIYLEDIETNTLTQLNTSNYSFTPDTDLTDTGRFYLRFGQSTLSTNTSELDNILIYNNVDIKQLIIRGLLNYETTLTLFDIQGRKVLSKDLDMNSVINTINTNSLVKGVYLVQLNNKEHLMTQKIIIR
ncbi:M14 family zinc carboxypeptidase [Winogradskyella sp.]|uniref:M14 family zinc carboxypeptidase n=1 Tax=Winogradskyella sp. TaxID=1883156 RepID=UPI0025D35DC0|nr:M14 family zinc carboxypeptidase [Winogradskyella sp.]MCT4630138.1 M14 family zinc carboxypeptidase [Winogradskyella sp.]